MAKVSLHISPKMSQEHNNRSYIEKGKHWNRDEHIDSSRTYLNVNLIDQPFKEFFTEKMAEPIKEFNSKQKNKDRITSVENEYAKAIEKKQPREVVIQLGKKDDQPLDRDGYIALYKEVLDDWQKKNPNLVVFGAYIHFDETTPHMHLDYLPLAHSSRGMPLKVSYEAALKEQGYTRGGSKFDCALAKHTADYRDHLEDLCATHVNNLSKHDQASKPHVEYLVYRKEQLKEENNQLEQMIDEKKEEIKELENEKTLLSVPEEHVLVKKILKSITEGKDSIPVSPDTATKMKNSLMNFSALSQWERQLKEKERNLIYRETEINKKVEEELRRRFPTEIDALKKENAEITDEVKILRNRVAGFEERELTLLRKFRNLLVEIFSKFFNGHLPEHFYLFGQDFGQKLILVAANEIIASFWKQFRAEDNKQNRSK